MHEIDALQPLNWDRASWTLRQKLAARYAANIERAHATLDDLHDDITRETQQLNALAAAVNNKRAEIRDLDRQLTQLRDTRSRLVERNNDIAATRAAAEQLWRKLTRP